MSSRLVELMDSLNINARKKDVSEMEDHKRHLALSLPNSSTSSPSKSDPQHHDLVTSPLFSGPVKMSVDPQTFPQYGLLAALHPKQPFKRDTGGRPVVIKGLSGANASQQDPRIFLNCAAPWSAFICGSQGSGKSHTLSCMLESMLLPSTKIGKLPHPLGGIVFHWDRFTSYGSSQVCEAAYLCSAGIKVKVLVSPTNFWRMQEVYENLPGLSKRASKPKVMPLMFQEKQLGVKKMMDMMGVSGTEGVPLYFEVILRILRQMAVKRRGKPGIDYRQFKQLLIEEDFSKQQWGPLKLRLDLLESFMEPIPKPGSSRRENVFADIGYDNEQEDMWEFEPGSLTIIDLSCPFVEESLACTLFSTCLELFLERKGNHGLVVALDEAHKFMTGTPSATSFTEDLLQVIRLQRHLATRIIIATQEPTISPRLLDLSSMTIVHRFTSPDWFQSLRARLAGVASAPKATATDAFWDSPSPSSSPPSSSDPSARIFEEIVRLRAGEALVFCPTAMLDVKAKGPDSSEVVVAPANNVGIKVMVRARLTADGGKSIMAP